MGYALTLGIVYFRPRDASALSTATRLPRALSSHPLPSSPRSPRVNHRCQRHADRPPSPTDATSACPLDDRHPTLRTSRSIPRRSPCSGPYHIAGYVLIGYRSTLPAFVQYVLFYLLSPQPALPIFCLLLLSYQSSNVAVRACRRHTPTLSLSIFQPLATRA